MRQNRTIKAFNDISEFHKKLGFPPMFMSCGAVKKTVTASFGVCVWRDCVSMPMEVRSLARCGCVSVFACVWVCVCVLVGTRPSESGKHCHSYINKSDSRDRRWVRRACEG